MRAYWHACAPLCRVLGLFRLPPRPLTRNCVLPVWLEAMQCDSDEGPRTPRTSTLKESDHREGRHCTLNITIPPRTSIQCFMKSRFWRTIFQKLAAASTQVRTIDFSASAIPTAHTRRIRQCMGTFVCISLSRCFCVFVSSVSRQTSGLVQVEAGHEDSVCRAHPLRLRLISARPAFFPENLPHPVCVYAHVRANERMCAHAIVR